MITLNQGDSQSIVLTLKAKSGAQVNLQTVELCASLVTPSNRVVRTYSTVNGSLKRDGNVLMILLDTDIPPGIYNMRWKSHKNGASASVTTKNFLKIEKCIDHEC